jgi:hypothetical protein
MEIPIHHFPELMSAFPHMRIADNIYTDPSKQMTQFEFYQEQVESEWVYTIKLINAEGYPALIPENEQCSLRYRYATGEYISDIYVQSILTTTNRYVTPVIKRTTVKNYYW